MMDKQTINIYIYAPDKSMIGKMEEHYVPFNKGEHLSFQGIMYEIISLQHILNIDYTGTAKIAEVLVIANPLKTNV